MLALKSDPDPTSGKPDRSPSCFNQGPGFDQISRIRNPAWMFLGPGTWSLSGESICWSTLPDPIVNYTHAVFNSGLRIRVELTRIRP